MQELYGDTKGRRHQKDPGGETDSSGSSRLTPPYEWDLDKKAWFPKVRVARAPLHSGPTWPALAGRSFHVFFAEVPLGAPLVVMFLCCVCGRTDV